MENIIVVGSSGHARALIEAVQCENRYQIAGLVDTFKPVGYSCLGFPVLGDELQLPGIVSQNTISGAVVAIGDNWVRHRMVSRIRSAVPNLSFVTVNTSIRADCF
jgi:FlaA1/EpsC-like NDP-sugar epimerase